MMPNVKGLAALALGALTTAGAASAAEVLSAEEEAARRLGFYFAVSLERTAIQGQARGIGVVVDEPSLGGLFDVTGTQANGETGDRFNFGFTLGFRLRNQNGRIESRFFQFDESEALGIVAPEGKVLANTLVSADAGFDEDIGQLGLPGGPDGSVGGVEAGLTSEANEPPDFFTIDGAEDWNFNGTPDFIQFATSDRIVGGLETDYQLFDVDYLRQLKRMRRFTLDWRAGLRLTSLNQKTDLAYQATGGFAVYTDNESDGPVTCGESVETQDGDGDGEMTAAQAQVDGDGFMDGDCDTGIFDTLETVPTLSEDRITAEIDTKGYGLRLGLDGRFELSKKWKLSGGFSVSLMATDTEFRYREVFTSERDRYLNFIEWDFNGDGVYDIFDLDFNGSCLSNPGEPCVLTTADQQELEDDGDRRYVRVTTRAGIGSSVVDSPEGTNADAFRGANAGRLRVGDPVPESERNRDTITETRLLRDVSGSDSGFTPMLDLHVGAEFHFSKFARLDFGLRTTRWFDAGNFRSLADGILAGGTPAAGDGDFTMDGYYIRLTVTPR